MRVGRAIGAAIVVAVALLVVAAAWFLLAGRSPDFARLRNDEQFNVVVITLDTTRADRLGAYGFEQVETPAIDSLARDGILFRRAYAAIPLTLPSHTSLFSGTYPPHHGVRDNANLVPGELATLAEAFRAAGYHTAAFVGSFVLDSRWGLDQGFETYDDDFGDLGKGVIAMGDVQRPGNEVVDAALDWMGRKPAGPFLLWVHLYDPHHPYDAPEPYRTRYPDDPYVAEIAFTDSLVGRLLADLEARGEQERTFVVLAGDHGEGLGEHGESTHGFFVYEEATHVPLIVSVPFDALRGIERDDVVSLVDVMPTILDMSGLEIPVAVQGESLTRLFDADAPAAPRLVYSESLYARLHFGWSPLTAIQDERYKLIMSSEPELYDLQGDPAESDDLSGRDTDLFDRLESAGEELLAEIGEDGMAPEMATADPETLDKLASLGYLSGVSASTDVSGTLASPRAMIDTYNKANRARALMQAEDFDEAERLFREVLRQDPGVRDVYRALGQLYAQQNRLDDAAALYEQAIPVSPEDPYFYLRLADTQLALGLSAEAARTMQAALAVVDPNADVYSALGRISRTEGDYPQAVRYFEQGLALEPDSAPARAELAAAYLRMGDRGPAEESARRALAIDDAVAGAHFTLAQIAEATGDLAAAADEYLRELGNSPEDTNALFNLAMIYRAVGRTAEEEEELNRLLDIDPAHARGLLALAGIYLDRGVEYRRAVEMATTAVQQPLESRELAFGYFLLAELYQRLGDPAKAQEYARLGRAVGGG